MATLGERLKEAREQRGVVLDEVHASTKIQKRYLEALEAQDWEVFPGAVFTQGYLRTYAEFLGLDPEFVQKAYARERRIEHAARGTAGEVEEREAVRAVLERLAQSKGVNLAARRRAIRRALIGLAATVAAAAVWGLLRVHATRADAAALPEKAAPARAAPPGRAGIGDRQPVVHPAAPSAGAKLPARAAVPDLAPVASPELVSRPPAGPTAESFVPPPVASRLSIPQYGVGPRVVGHALVDESRDFVEGKVVWFWTQVHGGRPGERIQHVWIHEGRRVGVIDLKLGGSQWRTQSRRKMLIGAAGAWTVEARDHAGQLLASASFRVAAL